MRKLIDFQLSSSLSYLIIYIYAVNLVNFYKL